MGMLDQLDSFKAGLKDKWLDYYEANYFWIKHCGIRSHIPVGYKNGARPRAELILGAITALEPSLEDLLPTFLQLTNDSEKIVAALGLHFDPDIELQKREAEIKQAEIVHSLPEANPNSEE